MKLLAMRDLNVQDPLPALGQKVKPQTTTPTAVAQPTERPGVFEKPDGKLETRIPENEKASGWARPIRMPGKSICNYFVQSQASWQDIFQQEFSCEGTTTGRIPSGASGHSLQDCKPGSNLNGKRARMIVLDDLAMTDFSHLEERVIAAWYAQYKELCK